MKATKKILLSALVSAYCAVSMTGCSQQSDSTSADKKAEITAAQAATPAQEKPDMKDADSNVMPSSTAEGDSLLSNVSYTLGYSVGANIVAQLKSQDVSLDNAEFLAGIKTAASGEKSKFTQAEMQTIMQAFQQKIITEQESKQVSAVLEHADALLNTLQTPTVGPKDAKVAVIEFFDYNCLFCSKMAPVMEKIIDANPNIQYIFKEFPIFGKRWESSQYAAEMGIAAYMLNGGDGYLKYHNAIFATGKDEGKLEVEDIKKIAAEVGIDVEKAENLIKERDIAKNIEDDLALGTQKLGIQGTPAIVVMPITGANVDNTTVIPGFSTEAKVQEAIDKAQGTANAGSTAAGA